MIFRWPLAHSHTQTQCLWCFLSLCNLWAWQQQQMCSHRHHHDSPLQFNPCSELDFWRAIVSWSWDPDADVLPSWLSWWLESVFSSCVSSFSSWLKSFSSSLSSFFSCWSSCWVASPASSSFAAFASSLATASCAGCWGSGRGPKSAAAAAVVVIWGEVDVGLHLVWSCFRFGRRECGSNHPHRSFTTGAGRWVVCCLELPRVGQAFALQILHRAREDFNTLMAFKETTMFKVFADNSRSFSWQTLNAHCL